MACLVQVCDAELQGDVHKVAVLLIAKESDHVLVVQLEQRVQLHT